MSSPSSVPATADRERDDRTDRQRHRCGTHPFLHFHPRIRIRILSAASRSLVAHLLARRRFLGGHSLRMSQTLPPTSEDTPEQEMTRRHFIEHVGFMSGTALLYAACKPSEPKKSETTVGPVVETSHRSLTNEEYDTVAAAVERICPRDEEPGAIDLGVPEYVDRALSTPTLCARPRRVRPRHRGADAPSAEPVPEGLRRARPRRAGRAAHRVQGLAPRAAASSTTGRCSSD